MALHPPRAGVSAVAPTVHPRRTLAVAVAGLDKQRVLFGERIVSCERFRPLMLAAHAAPGSAAALPQVSRSACCGCLLWFPVRQVVTSGVRGASAPAGCYRARQPGWCSDRQQVATVACAASKTCRNPAPRSGQHVCASRSRYHAARSPGVATAVHGGARLPASVPAAPRQPGLPIAPASHLARRHARLWRPRSVGRRLRAAPQDVPYRRAAHVAASRAGFVCAAPTSGHARSRRSTARVSVSIAT